MGVQPIATSISSSVKIGPLIDMNLEQPSNATLEIAMRFSGKCTEVKEMQLQNAWS